MRYVSTRGGTPPLGFSDAVAAGWRRTGGCSCRRPCPTSASWRAFRASVPELCVASSALRDRHPRGGAPGAGRALLRRFSTGPRSRRCATSGRACTSSSSSTGRRWPSRISPSSCWEPLRAPVRGPRGDDQRPRRHLRRHGAAAIHGLMGQARARSSSSIRTGGCRRCRSARWPARARPTSRPRGRRLVRRRPGVLKELFGDGPFRTRHRLSAVNSINIARVLAQCVYYLHAWLRLPGEQRATAEFVVPTGNFGNVLAGWMLQKMGVPIRGFRVATNQNDILHRLFTTGEYRGRRGEPEPRALDGHPGRLQFRAVPLLQPRGRRDRVRAVMAEIGGKGAYTFADFDRDTSRRRGARCRDPRHHPAGPPRAYGYIVDPHTACAFKDMANPDRPSVVLATAPGEVPGHDPRRDRDRADPSRARGAEGPPLVRHKIVADANAIRGFIEARAV
jgi:threonine synthase